MSKFERYKRKGESYYIYPHKHCQKCGQMITDESLTYCSDCYNIIQEKRSKKKRRFRKKETENE